MSIDDKVREAAGSRLEPGETILAATKAFPEGGLRKIARRTAAFGVVGGAVGAAIAGAGDGVSAGKNGLALAITDRRLLALSLSALTGSPKELVAVLPLDRVKGIETGGTKVFGIETGTVTLTLDDGTTQTFEIPKASMKDGERVLEHLRSSVGTSSGTVPPPPPPP
jgi:hypothetical protein